jgi:ElaA protein
MSEDDDIDADGEGGVDWHLLRLKAMSGPEVYDMLALRQQVFMVEQAIPVLDADGLDHEALHLCGRSGDGLIAYARILILSGETDQEADEASVEAVKIGRVVVAQGARGQGLGRELMLQALSCAAELAPDAEVRMSAQAHLVAFYESLGFAADGDVYDDHGVPHVDMVRPPSSPDEEIISSSPA